MVQAQARPNVEVMQLHRHREAPADTRRQELAAAKTNSLTPRLSIPRAAMNVLLVQARAAHHALRSRGMAPFTFVRGHDKLPPTLFSHREYQHDHGLAFSRSWRMRSMLRAVRVLPGNSATADPPFSPDRFALSGGTSRRAAAARTGRVCVLLERNPPNRPLVPAGTPAF